MSKPATPTGYSSPYSPATGGTARSESSSAAPSRGAHTPTIATPTSSSSKQQSKHNIFSDDGSFLEKFQKERLKDLTDESLAAKLALKRKREAEERLKSRGKKTARKSATPEPQSSSSGKKNEEESDGSKNAYLEAVAEYSKSQSGLKDIGSGQQTYVK